MSKFFSSKRRAKNKPPTHTSEHENITTIVNQWLFEDYKIEKEKEAPPPPPPPPIEEPAIEKAPVVKRDPRIETGLLKYRIAEKLKRYNSNSN